MATKATQIETPNEASFPSGGLPEWFGAVDPPYSVDFTVVGVKSYLLNRYNADLIEQGPTEGTRRVKRGPAPESMITLNEDGEISVPGEQFREALISVAKNYRNPRNKMGSLATVYREGLVNEQELCSFGVKDWDFLDSRRGRNGQSFVTKIRPGLLPGWRLTGKLNVLLPQYITPVVLNHTLIDAGRIGGIGDGRSLGFGRFVVERFEVATG